jgi:hypothetical protein
MIYNLTHQDFHLQNSFSLMVSGNQVMMGGLLVIISMLVGKMPYQLLTNLLKLIGL